MSIKVQNDMMEKLFKIGGLNGVLRDFSNAFSL
jgi:hypothetical protein